MIDHYQVVGNPIAQSRSPFIHRCFAQQTHQLMEYGRFCPPVDGFREAADAFFASGGKGMNITAPFKLDAYQYANRLSPRAKLAGAVNTLALQKDGSILGDNTDGVGLVTDLVSRVGWPITDRRVLILGAGGAVRGVLQMLLEQHPAQLTIANRTVSKARDLAAVFSHVGAIESVGFDQLSDLPGASFDLIINATSAGLTGAVPPLPKTLVNGATRCYDMTYGAELTAFLRWAQAQGATQLVDGLGMLVAQAAESFHVWRGVQPAVQPVYDALRQSLSASPA